MRANWQELYGQIQSCGRCGLSGNRTRAVVGRGNPQADLMLIGEGPGRDEDLQGKPFVGAAGRLLDKMIAAMGLSERDVYICNVVKCRPPGNRDPEPEEAAACLPYLRAQFVLVRPRIVVALGRVAAAYICGGDVRITRDHGVFRESAGVWILPTYHPAALLRDETKKKDAWADLQTVMRKYAELECGAKTPGYPDGTGEMTDLQGVCGSLVTE